MTKTKNPENRKTINTDTGYTVETIMGCRVIKGPIPLGDMGKLTKGFSKKAGMDIGIADLIGATMVIGEPEDLDRLRQSNLTPSTKRVMDAKLAEERGFPPGVVEWLLSGERGLSSIAMCQAMFGLPDQSLETNHPSDPADLRRCLKLVDAAGPDELWRIDKLSEVSAEWAALVASWGELTECFASEIGESQSGPAPKTNALMRSIIEEANSTPSPST